MSTHIEAAVARLLEVRRGGAPVDAEFIAAHPLSVADALVVQARVQEACAPVGAWKVAPGSTVEHRNFAPIYSNTVHGASARFARNAFRKPAIECEIAFRIGRDLCKPPYDREQVASAITGAVALIEICDSRLADRKAASEGWRLADNATNGAILAGPLLADWRALDTERQPVVLSYNGKVVAEKTGNPGGDLVAVIQRLADQAGTHCGGIRAGQIVTTGSMTGYIEVEPGTEVVARFPGLGELQVVFEK